MNTRKTANGTMQLFDARLPKEQKLFFEKAAQMGGYSSLTDFIVAAVMEKAKSIVADNEQFIVSQRDSEIFFNALMQQIEPNDELKKTANEYARLFTDK